MTDDQRWDTVTATRTEHPGPARREPVLDERYTSSRRRSARVENGAPNYIAQGSWSASSAAFNDHSHAAQLDTTFGVDRSIGQLWSALPDNTVVLFMSDNGLAWGEHRWSGKMVPYNEAIRIPMAVAGKNLANPLPVNGTDPRGSFSTSTCCRRSKGTQA
ncbi:MAG: hypothetical protein E6F95_11505 [Actinobacteria bacterium]|nr:MAG: hypothetical protein E6F95_11505 [Actinomycetota bacterium]